MTDEIAMDLVEAQKELADLKAEYQEFAYIVSHDLSAVLRQVGGFAQIVYDKHANNFDTRTLRHFELIIEGAETGKDLLEGLLLFSRLNTVDAPKELVDCNTIASECVESLSELIISTGAEISIEDLPTLPANRVRLAQVLYNLIHNALIFVDNDVKPKIRITAKDADNLWLFGIEDNGIGIRSQYRDNIFDVLQTAAGKKFEGLGMGLAIARKIIQQHGGSIWVNSEIGEGSKFYFTLSKK